MFDGVLRTGDFIFGIWSNESSEELCNFIGDAGLDPCNSEMHRAMIYVLFIRQLRSLADMQYWLYATHTHARTQDGNPIFCTGKYYDLAIRKTWQSNT